MPATKLTPDKNGDVDMHIRLPLPTCEAVAADAKKEKRSLSRQVAVIVEKALARRVRGKSGA